jgi:hypothetical protein
MPRVPERFCGRGEGGAPLSAWQGGHGSVGMSAGISASESAGMSAGMLANSVTRSAP